MGFNRRHRRSPDFWEMEISFIDIRGYYGFINIQKDPINGKNNTGALVWSLGYAVKI